MHLGLLFVVLIDPLIRSLNCYQLLLVTPNSLFLIAQILSCPLVHVKFLSGFYLVAVRVLLLLFLVFLQYLCIFLIFKLLIMLKSKLFEVCCVFLPIILVKFILVLFELNLNLRFLMLFQNIRFLYVLIYMLKQVL